MSPSRERTCGSVMRVHSWGTLTFDCQQIIKNELHDQNVRVCCIGPAGEHLSKIACIINERRAVGRKGLGAVMGSKNLKAIAIRGTDTRGYCLRREVQDRPCRNAQGF